jgi:hypothetical protein
VCLPREACLAGLRLRLYNLVLKLFQGKVVKIKLRSKGNISQQSRLVALGF